MIVYVYPLDKWGCGYHRLIWPSFALAHERHDVRVIEPGANTGFRTEIVNDQLAHLDYPRDADVIVFQRVTHVLMPDTIRRLRESGVAVVVDVDDDLGSIYPVNPAYAALHPKYGQRDYAWTHLTAACRLATLVTVSANGLLERYAPHGRGHVLHNAIPKLYLDHPRVDADDFGWPASFHSHANDPPAVGSSVRQLVNEGYAFRVVSAGGGCGPGFALREDPPDTGPIKIEEWYREMAKLGVGIAPLADTRFNFSKSWLKPLELSSLGVPWVASPRAEYKRFWQSSAAPGGYLAEKSRDWYRKLKALLNDPVMRKELGEMGRVHAADHTIEGNAWRWWEAWDRARRLQDELGAP